MLLPSRETRRELEEARISAKKAAARSDELLKIDIDLCARSRGQIANARDHFKQERQNAAHGSRYLLVQSIKRCWSSISDKQKGMLRQANNI